MIKNTLRVLLESGIVRPLHPASERDIAVAESQLGVVFPAAYRDLLKTCGALGIYDGIVYGIGQDPAYPHDESMSVVFQTRYARETLGLPSHLVVIWDSSHEDAECLDTSRIRGGDCPIVYFDRPIAESRARRPRALAPSLEKWLLRIVERQLKVKALCDREFPGMFDEMGNVIRRRRRRTAKRRASRPTSRKAERTTRKHARRSKG